jgi:hypothetical protein
LRAGFLISHSNHLPEYKAPSDGPSVCGTRTRDGRAWMNALLSIASCTEMNIFGHLLAVIRFGHAISPLAFDTIPSMPRGGTPPRRSCERGKLSFPGLSSDPLLLSAAFFSPQIPLANWVRTPGNRVVDGCTRELTSPQSTTRF